MKKIKIYIILILFISIVILKETVAIQINSINDYKTLVQLGIELDHYRTTKLAHAYATDDEIELLKNHGFIIFILNLFPPSSLINKMLHRICNFITI